MIISNVVKEYPKMFRIYVYKEPVNYNYSATSYGLTVKKPIQKEKKPSALSVLRSVQRSRTTVSDLVLCNSFELFCTFTFAKDRHDIPKSRRKMSNWLHAQRLTSPDMKYLIVPERHKKCVECAELREKTCPHPEEIKPIHFHALISGYNGRLKDSGLKKSGRRIYNLTGYRSGHSTAVRIENQDAVAAYVKKYITKDMPKIFGGQRRYWTSQNLIRPIKTTNGLATSPFRLSDTSKVYDADFFEVFEIVK